MSDNGLDHCAAMNERLEAENAQRELFGFERSLEISKRSAQEIAEAARAWGQTDDITVVTIRRRS